MDKKRLFQKASCNNCGRVYMARIDSKKMFCSRSCAISTYWKSGILKPHGNKPDWRGTLKERFMSFISVDANGCWIWTGNKNRQGYGSICIGKRNVRANRAAWEIFMESIPPGIQVLHKCDIPECANPDHLFLGTPKDNVADAIAKSRHRPPPVGKKLNPQTVREIFNSRDGSSVLANRHHISKVTVYKIKRREIWAKETASIA